MTHDRFLGIFLEWSQVTCKKENEANDQRYKGYNVTDEKIVVLLNISKSGEAEERAKVGAPIEPVEVFKNHWLTPANYLVSAEWA